MTSAFGNIDKFIVYFIYKAMFFCNSAAPVSFVLMPERFRFTFSLKGSSVNIFNQFGNSGKYFWFYKRPLAVILVCAFFKLQRSHFFNNLFVSKLNSSPLKLTTWRLCSIFSMAMFKFSAYSFGFSFCSTRGRTLLYEMVISASRSLLNKSISRLKKLLFSSEVFKCTTVSICEKYLLQR